MHYPGPPPTAQEVASCIATQHVPPQACAGIAMEGVSGRARERERNGDECMIGEVEKKRKGSEWQLERRQRHGVMEWGGDGRGGGGGGKEKGAVFMLTSEVVQTSQAPEKVRASGRKRIRET